MKKRSLSLLIAVAAVTLITILSFVSPVQTKSATRSQITTDVDMTEAVKHDVQAAKTVSLKSMSYAIKGSGSSASTPAAKRWSSKTITYKISGSSSYYKAVWNAAVSHWNKAGVVNLVPTTGKADINLATSNAPKSATAGVVGVTYSSYYSNKSLNGLKVLASAKSYVYRNVSAKYHYSQVERAHVAEHELGHALGLEHATPKHAIMYYATRDQTITTSDVKGLAQSYK